MTRFTRISAAVFGMAAITAPVLAHHSFASFDREKTVVIKGTVTNFEWQNPHVWLWVMVPRAGATPDKLWGIEATDIGSLIRLGWTKSVVKAGDKVTVQINPLRDGRPGGSMINLTLPSGKVLGPGGRPLNFGQPDASGTPKP